MDRDPNPHLSFAPGLHQCLGLHLARVQLRAVLQALLQRCRSIEVDSQRSLRLQADRFRGFDRLMVCFEPMAALLAGCGLPAALLNQQSASHQYQGEQTSAAPIPACPELGDHQ